MVNKVFLILLFLPQHSLFIIRSFTRLFMNRTDSGCRRMVYKALLIAANLDDFLQKKE